MDELNRKRAIGGQDNIVGLFLGPPNQIADFDNLGAIIPVHSETRLCAAFASREGSYKGLFGYDATALKPGAYLVDFPSEHVRDLRGQRADEFAVSLWFASSCSDRLKPESVRLPVFWSAVPDKRVIRILINSERLAARIYDKGRENAGSHSWPCNDVDSDKSDKRKPATTFNKVCDYDWPQPGLRTIELQLLSFEDIQEDLSFAVDLP